MSQSTNRPNPTTGPMVRLRGLPYCALPVGGIGIHPDGTEENLNADANIHPTQGLRRFITDVLKESSPFIDGMGSDSRWDTDKSGTFAHGGKHFKFYNRVVSARDINKKRQYSQIPQVEDDEVWYARRTLHVNGNARGTANWCEFTRDIKENHARTEEAVSDDVTAKQCMRWDTNNLIVDIDSEQWTNITMAVVEMRHKMPIMLTKRTFPVVLITASLNRSEGNEFLVISIPIIDFETTTWAQLSKEENQVVAAYASIERFRTVPRDNGTIEWIMATTSDPKGRTSHFLPFIEGTTMPSVIKKDVKMYLEWVQRQRTDGAQPAQARQQRPSLFARGETFFKDKFRMLSREAVIPPRN